jgi:hypothetical protein
VKSLDLNRAYYQECIAPLLVRHCPAIGRRHAAALVGWGSEVLGYDDAYSRAYGWGPRVVLFLAEEDLGAREEVRQALAARVPPMFMEFPTRYTDPTQGPPLPTLDPDGWLQVPVTTAARFVRLYLGLADVDPRDPALSSRDWLVLPEHALLRVTAGEVYHDGVGELTALRDFFATYPDDVWRYRLAYAWTSLSWDIDLIGLCAGRGDAFSARIALGRSVERIVALAFLLNRAYHPGYLKWVEREFARLPHLAAEIGPVLEEALLTPDPAAVVDLLYPVLDALIAFQQRCANLPVVACRQPAGLDRGFFAYDLGPVIEALRASITGPLAVISCTVGAIDQWLTDQDMLMSPDHLRLLCSIYDAPDPLPTRFKRETGEEVL